MSSADVIECLVASNYIFVYIRLNPDDVHYCMHDCHSEYMCVKYKGTQLMRDSIMLMCRKCVRSMKYTLKSYHWFIADSLIAAYGEIIYYAEESWDLLP